MRRDFRALRKRPEQGGCGRTTVRAIPSGPNNLAESAARPKASRRSATRLASARPKAAAAATVAAVAASAPVVARPKSKPIARKKLVSVRSMATSASRAVRACSVVRSVTPAIRLVRQVQIRPAPVRTTNHESWVVDCTSDMCSVNECLYSPRLCSDDALNITDVVAHAQAAFQDALDLCCE